MINQKESRPADFLAADLLRKTLVQNRTLQPIRSILLALKNRKHPQHKVERSALQKFSNHILSQLKKIQPSLEDSINAFVEIGRLSAEIESSQSQIQSIFEGFKEYWMKGGKKQVRKALIRNYFEFHEDVCDKVVEVFREPFLKQNKNLKVYQDFAVKMVRERISPLPNAGIRKKCLSLIYYLNLFEFFSVEEVMEITKILDVNKIAYIFQVYGSKQGNKKLINAYIEMMSKKDFSKIKALFKKINVNPFDYPSYLQILYKNTIRYFIKEHPLDLVEFSFHQNPNYLPKLVEVLIEQKKIEDASYIATKYKLQQFSDLYHEKHFQRQNRLQALDNFCPTEHFFTDSMKKYISLDEWGIKEKDVKWIAKENIKEKELSSILKSDLIGMDSESNNVFHMYENQNPVLLQISSKTKIYIFDTICLKENQILRSWFKELVTNYKGKIVGHTIEADIKELLVYLNLPTVQRKTTLVDVSKMYKQKYPEESKTSLKFMSSHLLGKEVSKFEQCSCWQNRPLRKSQLHYAALDAFLPLKLYDRLI